MQKVPTIQIKELGASHWDAPNLFKRSGGEPPKHANACYSVFSCLIQRIFSFSNSFQNLKRIYILLKFEDFRLIYFKMLAYIKKKQ